MREKYSRCPSCGVGKIMSDELRRDYNARINGKKVCADCYTDHLIGEVLSGKKTV